MSFDILANYWLFCGLFPGPDKSDAQFDYRFSVGQLPAWAQKQVANFVVVYDCLSICS